MNTLNLHDKECSSDNYCKSSAEYLAKGFCPPMAMKFHKNLTEGKIVKELITSVQSLNYPASQFTQLSRVLFPVLHV